MKKVITLISILSLMGYFYIQNLQSVVLDDIMNIEALATGEYSGHLFCMKWGTIVCPATGNKVEYIVTLSQPYQK